MITLSVPKTQGCQNRVVTFGTIIENPILSVQGDPACISTYVKGLDELYGEDIMKTSRVTVIHR